MASYHLFTNSWKSWVKTPLGSLGGGCGAGQTGGGESSRMLLESGRKGASQPVPLRTARHLSGTLRTHPSWRQSAPTPPFQQLPQAALPTGSAFSQSFLQKLFLSGDHDWFWSEGEQGSSSFYGRGWLLLTTCYTVWATTLRRCLERAGGLPEKRGSPRGLAPHRSRGGDSRAQSQAPSRRAVGLLPVQGWEVSVASLEGRARWAWASLPGAGIAVSPEPPHPVLSPLTLL